jgi:hypothetical protein
MLVEHQTSMQVTDRGSHQIRHRVVRQRPMLHQPLALGQFFALNRRELEHTAHRENSRRQGGDATLFSGGELRRESIDLLAPRDEVGERFGRWCFDWLLHQNPRVVKRA